jgi:hypothetical protein
VALITLDEDRISVLKACKAIVSQRRSASGIDPVTLSGLVGTIEDESPLRGSSRLSLLVPRDSHDGTRVQQTTATVPNQKGVLVKQQSVHTDPASVRELA